MKKLWWLLPVALLAAGSLVFLGCPNGDDDDDDGDWYNSLASVADPLVITLENNFQYGDGFQGQYAEANLMKGKKVTKGKTYWLDVTFTADRDLEDAIWAGLVDTVTDYWNPLTWDGSDDDDEGALLAPEGEDETYIVEEGEEVSIRVKMVALKTAANATTAYNKLNIQSKGEPDPGNVPAGTNGSEDNRGVLDDVKLTFTRFVFACADEFDDSEVPGFEPPPPPPELEITVDGTAYKTTEYRAHGGEIEIAADGSGFTYTVSGTMNYQGNFAFFKVDLGSDKIGDFSEITFDFDVTNAGTGGTGYKKLELWAKTTAFTQFPSFVNVDTNFDATYTPSTGVGIGIQDSSQQYTGPTDEEAMTITIGGDVTVSMWDSGSSSNKDVDVDLDKHTDALKDSSQLFFAIYYGSDKAGGVSYTISNIKFVK